MMSSRQAKVFPVLAFVDAFINANSCVGRPAAVYFTRSNPDYARSACFFFPMNGDISYYDNILFIENRFETLAVVDSVPKSASCISYIELGGVCRVYFEIRYAAAHHGRTYIAERNA